MYKIDKFYNGLAARFTRFSSVFSDSIFRLINRDRMDVSSSEDVIVSRSISNAITNNRFSDLIKIDRKGFEQNIKKRTRKFSFNDRKVVKIEAAKCMTTAYSEKISESTLKQASKLVQAHLKLDKKILRPCSINKASTSFKLQTSAGFYWFTKKANCVSDIIETAKAISVPDDLSALIFFPVYISYRVQQRPSDVKLRLIYVYSALIVLFEQIFLTPLLEHFLNTETPYVVGLSGNDLRNRYFLWNNKRFKYSLDWRSFDWTASTLLIKYSFFILKESFSMSSYQALLYDFISYYFINTPFVSNIEKSDDFVLMFKKRGIPSGSSFTNLVGTIVNMLAVYCFCIDNGLEIRSEDFGFLGDDVIFACDSEFTIEKFSIYFLRNFGMTLSAEKCMIYTKDEPIYFLGGNISDKGRLCNPELLLYQCSTTTSDLFVKCKTTDEHIRRIWNKCCSTCFKYTDGYKVFDRIWPEIEVYLGKSYFSTEYTEVYSRATVPGSDDKEVGSIRNFNFMREFGWLIQ